MTHHVLKTLHHDEGNAPAQLGKRLEIVDVILSNADDAISNVITHIAIENETEPVVLKLTVVIEQFFHSAAGI